MNINNAKRIGINQMGMDNPLVSFEYKGNDICNPFIDPTGRFELTLEKSYEIYGRDNVDKFISECENMGDK